MAYRCTVCDKGVRMGKSISHSHRKTNRRFSPNLQRVKVKTASGAKRQYVCTTCLRSGKIKKAA
ncbi:MAG: 50S ribosomal protein L28 [Elusimicrobia bacterium]|jgi:large subunit ribosomal protein L28|nr:50S ribosomal protein L28 [Elusimicrobiota bacterium]MBK7208193.1 50S ribosomal protein L28 [Elusimicrobiota bacterium]MBK7544957.1 50S ribosomal protein L28 [Elusimicrobiota bacterium]MBK7574474.1 50S ribosomal protein L28 [Elusimicrobiota bacterium]MBK7688162.1 50S ribosomal protein L28 [Elusimicrobiota bacterium]